MFDAEIAAVLLNRRKLAGDAAAALLHEGNLKFTREIGSLDSHLTRDPEQSGGEAGRFHLECLLFADGSRALRITVPDGAEWTRWNAIEPAMPPPERLLDTAVAETEE